MTDFPSLLKLLVAGQVEFIVVGGAAAAAHGSARLTKDLDVVTAGARRISGAWWRYWLRTSPICEALLPDFLSASMLRHSIAD